MFRLNFEEDFLEEFMQGSRDVLTSGRPISQNKYVTKFEDAFKELVNAPYALAVNSGTMALEIAMRALNVRGRVVIIPSNTFFATQIAAMNAGATLEWVDIDPDFLQICPKDLEAVVARHPPGAVAAVVIVHIGGLISPHIFKVREICKQHGIALVEDAAHGHLAHMNGEWAGTIGDAAAFSFFPTKVMTAGEAGMITTQDYELHKRMERIKEFGRDVDAPISRLVQEQLDATNGRISELTGLLGWLECSRVQARVERRNEWSLRYKACLDERFYKVIRQPVGRSADYKCIVKLLGPMRFQREGLRDFATSHGINFTAEVYFQGVHEMPAYVNMTLSHPLPITVDATRNHVCPPLYPELEAQDVDHVCTVMNAFANSIR